MISASQYMSSIAYGASSRISCSKTSARNTLFAPQMTLTTRSAFCPRFTVTWYDQYMNARMATNGFHRRWWSQTESIRPDAAAMPVSRSIASTTFSTYCGSSVVSSSRTAI